MKESRFPSDPLNRMVLAALACLLGCGVARGGDLKAVDLTPPKKAYAQEYVQPFNEKTEDSPDWVVIGPVGERDVRYEAAGLRITLPTGWKGDRPATGVRSRFRVKGDFEITLSFEILKEPDQADAGGNAGTRVNLGVIKDVPREDVTTVGRVMSPTNGRRFSGWALMWDGVTEKKVPHSISRPTKAMTGRLRLVRSGADVHYAFSDGFDAGFTYFKKFPFGAEDLAQVRIVANTGGEKAALDVRVTDFRIRADSIPDMPGAAVAVPAAAPGPGAAIPQAQAPPATADRGWLMAALLIGGAVVLVFAAVLVAGFLLFRRRGGQAPIANQNAKNKR